MDPLLQDGVNGPDAVVVVNAHRAVHSLPLPTPCPLALLCAPTQVFAGVPLSRIPPPPRVLDVGRDTPLSEVVELLNERGILAVPVRNPDASPGDAWRQKYLGTGKGRGGLWRRNSGGWVGGRARVDEGV